MRKLILGAMAAFLLLTGCAAEPSPAEPVLLFQCRAQIVTDSMEVSCTVRRSAADMTKIEIESPESLSGFVVNQSGSELSLSYQGIAIAQGTLPEDSFILQMLAALDIAAQDGGLVSLGDGSFSGQIQNRDFVLKVDQKTGFLLQLELFNPDIQITFSEMTPISA